MALRFASAVVSIHFDDWGQQTVIQLRSNVLLGVSHEPTAAVLVEVNRLNCESAFGRWAYYQDEGVLALEYDMIGDHLQEPELMGALTTVAMLADHQDDQLQVLFGGRRATD